MKLLTCAHWLTYAHVAALAHLGAYSTRARIFFLMQIRRDTAISTTITSWTGLRREQELFIQFRISHSTSGFLFPVSKTGRQKGGGGGGGVRAEAAELECQIALKTQSRRGREKDGVWKEAIPPEFCCAAWSECED